MTLTAILPALVAVAGALVYALVTGPKLAEIGRVALWTGLLVTLMAFSRVVVRL